MAELLPEVQLLWVAEDWKPGGRRPTVTDILTWLQCFGIYVSAIAPSYPEAVPELLAYILEIVGQAKRFRGRTWVLYDATFYRQAAASGNRQWSEVNSTLLASCYSGEAPSSLGCQQFHTRQESALFTEQMIVFQAEHLHKHSRADPRGDSQPRQKRCAGPGTRTGADTCYAVTPM